MAHRLSYYAKYIFSLCVEILKRLRILFTYSASKVEEALHNANAEEEAKQEFLSILAHKLRNPLAVILSSVELLKLEEPRTPETSRLLQTIEQSIHLVTGLLGDLLDISDPPQQVSTHLSLPADVRPLLTVHPKRRGAIISRAKHTRTILVVDDNEAAAEALKRLLELRGHEVAIAYSGSEAIHKALQLRPQIIILDIGLPDMDGYEIVRILQGQKDFLPILIALTGYGHRQDKRRALKAGFHLHLTKPVGFKEIESAFREAPQTFIRSSA